MDTEKQCTENAVNIPELPIVQIACTGSEHPADNLICLKSMIDFMNDSVVAIGGYTEFGKGSEDGMSSILRIISHDIGVIASQIPIRQIKGEKYDT